VQTLSTDTITIMEATAPRIQAKAAAITFRTRHGLSSVASRGRLEMVPRALIPAEVQGTASFYSSLKPALMLALSEALGKIAPVAVLNAWKQAFRSLTERLAA
jgi:hemoglobin-like flavoprotein